IALYASTARRGSPPPSSPVAGDSFPENPQRNHRQLLRATSALTSSEPELSPAKQNSAMPGCLSLVTCLALFDHDLERCQLLLHLSYIGREPRIAHARRLKHGKNNLAAGSVRDHAQRHVDFNAGLKLDVMIKYTKRVTPYKTKTN